MFYLGTNFFSFVLLLGHSDISPPYLRLRAGSGGKETTIGNWRTTRIWYQKMNKDKRTPPKIVSGDQLKELMEIPGVGKSIATDLLRIGIKSVADLKGKSPQALYDESNALAGTVQDRCLLYTFRCAVYYANTVGKKRDPEKLKWWNWKDKKKTLLSGRF